jgi:hypothetical protein
LVGNAYEATASDPRPKTVTIATVGTIVKGSQVGTITASGAIADEGTFEFREYVHRDFAYAGIGAPTFGIVRSVEFFAGQFGTFDLPNTIRYTVTGQAGLYSVIGTWSVLRGTGDYARLHGQGTITGVIDATGGSERFLFTLTGKVRLG